MTNIQFFIGGFVLAAVLAVLYVVFVYKRGRKVSGSRKLLMEKEKEYVKTLGSPAHRDAKLIGFKTIIIPKESVSEFNDFYFKNKERIDAIPNHYYDPKIGEMRVYFPVREAIVKIGGSQSEASEYGILKFDTAGNLGSIDPASFVVIGRRQTDKVRGTAGNIIKDGTIFLAAPVNVHHIVDDNFLIFDFGERKLTNHHDHAMSDGSEEPGGAPMAPVGCMANHGGVNCTTAFGVGQGRCPFNAAVCMDYNGIFTDCVNAGGGWAKYRNFILSDCDFAMGQGHCWNEVM